MVGRLHSIARIPQATKRSMPPSSRPLAFSPSACRNRLAVLRNSICRWSGLGSAAMRCRGVVAMRGAVPIDRGKAPDLVTTRAALARGLVEILALHIEHHGGADKAQKVWDHKARALAAPCGGDNQTMREGGGAEKLRAGFGLAHLAQQEPAPGLCEKSRCASIRALFANGSRQKRVRPLMDDKGPQQQRAQRGKEEDQPDHLPDIGMVEPDRLPVLHQEAPNRGWRHCR